MARRNADQQPADFQYRDYDEPAPFQYYPYQAPENFSFREHDAQTPFVAPTMEEALKVAEIALSPQEPKP